MRHDAAKMHHLLRVGCADHGSDGTVAARANMIGGQPLDVLGHMDIERSLIARDILKLSTTRILGFSQHENAGLALHGDIDERL